MFERGICKRPKDHRREFFMLQDIIGSKTELFADGVQTVLRGHENRQRYVTLLKGNLVNNARSEA